MKAFNGPRDGYVSVTEAQLYETRLHELMRQIADEAAEREIYSGCIPVRENDLCWWKPLHDIDITAVEPAIEYLHLRGLIEYDSTGRLVRFVEGQS